MLDEQNNATSYLDLEDEDIAVTNILEKYKLSNQHDSSFLFDIDDDYKQLMQYIAKLYIKNETLPAEISHELNNNINFRKFLIKAIKQKLQNIFFDKRTVVFKEIVIIINLLSFGKDYKIFENYISYNINNLSELFRDYEAKLEENKDNKEQFEVLFSHYTLLIETVNVLCKVNSTDVQRKKSINAILEILTETINILKFKIDLNEERINILNNILGKLLFYYAHIPYINIKNKSVKELVDEFFFNFEKSNDGYELSKSTHFGNSNELNEYKIYLNTITTLLSNMIYKLETEYDYNEYKDLINFKNILDLYEETIIHTYIPKFKTISEFKNHLINNYIFIYSSNCEDDIFLIINDFFKNKNFDNSTIQIIYAITLYSTQIKNDILIDIIKKFLAMEKFDNDYLEFYKINICDVIIHRFIRQNSFIIDDELARIIVDYVNKNSVASHLISVYTKIFLSLSLYYSYSYETKSIELSKNYFAIYKNINGNTLLENEYKTINDKIFINYGKRLIKELDLDYEYIEDEKYYELGRKSVLKHINQNKINKTYYMNQKLSDVITNILNEKNLYDEKVNKYIEEFISKEVFYGLAFAVVDGLCQKDCTILDLGYETVKIPLFSNFELKIIYSTVYKEVFQHLFINNKEYMKKNVSNIIISYQKTIPMFFDKITGLRNVNRLQKDLNDIKNEFIFIEFYINNIDEYNEKLSYAKTDIILRNYAKELESFLNIYRLSGPKFGAILPLNSNMDSYIQKIQKTKIIYQENQINFDLTFAVSWGNSENILEKSAHCITLARKSKEKYYEFK
ncbi:hypothetical protein CPG38_05090 [Malaciobacter marinus]|uniref:hypothetical protein n=1 Tax=Malaciobacter marinus TaxID=505249 RepID=UPI000C078934|nr:hypothetical protein [Malaciobacter marinus]PHO12869.1 hypothetical protein CPG38_05090 [Malaciobacter marinus]